MKTEEIVDGKGLKKEVSSAVKSRPNPKMSVAKLAEALNRRKAKIVPLKRNVGK